MMIAPMYANGIETKTLDQDKKPAALVLLRFTYTEGLAGPDKKIRPVTFPVATIFLPRSAAKAFMKKFYGLMSVEDEHGLGGNNAKPR